MNYSLILATARQSLSSGNAEIQYILLAYVSVCQS